ncbi:MAG: helix-turn-helix transcriptional regulator [Nostoc sp. C3-bin3]|nr:helix-turn-helix transcriptional regulator [Nostoc sp. C3-bin3]
MKEGSKYQPLLEFLRGSDQNEITLSFAEIETLIKDILPNSAKNKRAWWSNRSKGALQALGWIEAGYRVENVDFDQQQVTFRKPPYKYQVQPKGDAVQWNAELIKKLRQHMDLTQAEFAQTLGVRQATVSEWEAGIHLPSRATSKYISMIAEQSNFTIGE